MMAYFAAGVLIIIGGFTLVLMAMGGGTYSEFYWFAGIIAAVVGLAVASYAFDPDRRRPR